MILNLNSVHKIRYCNKIPAIHVRHEYFNNSLFPSFISEWNKLDWTIRNSGSLSIFKKNLLNFKRLCSNSIFDVHNPYGTKLLTRLHQGLSHLHDHKLRHCFQDTLDPLCYCGIGTEIITQFFLHCLIFHTPRQNLFNNRNIIKKISSHGKYQLIEMFVYGTPNL